MTKIRTGVTNLSPVREELQNLCDYWGLESSLQLENPNGRYNGHQLTTAVAIGMMPIIPSQFL